MKIKNHSTLSIGLSQKLPVNGFKWVENTFQFKKDSIKSYIEESDEGYILEVDVQYPEKLDELHNDLTFLSAKLKIEKLGKLIMNLHDRKKICYSYIKFITNIRSHISFKNSA